MKLTIGLPTYETYKHEMVGSLLRNLLRLPHEIYFSMPKGCYIGTAREFVMCEAIKAGAEKVVFIDSDMAFSPHAIEMLLAHQHTIVGAAYHEKRLSPDGKPVSTVKLDDGKGGYLTGVADMPKEPFMCAAVGTGLMALYLPVILDKMEPPFFEYDRQAGKFAGEDVFFCQKARAAGLEIWADPTILVRHMGDWPY